VSRFGGLVTLEPWGLAVVSETVVVDETAVAAQPEHGPVPLAARKAARWQTSYIRTAVFVDVLCMLIAASVAVNVRFNGPSNRPAAYLAITFVLPLLWGVTMRLCGAYDPKLIGVGSDEFRRVLNAGVCMTAAVAIASYVTRFDLARSYVAIALPTATVLNLLARYWLRKRLHARRATGYAMQRVVAVGHPDSVASLISELGRWHSHGLSVVGACLTGDIAFFPTISGVPVVGGVDETTRAVATLEADTVAVLACPELSGGRMRELAWELEKSGTDVYIAPAVLDIAEARTTIRPIAGLPLLHLEHPERTGSKLVIKSLFDRTAAAIALTLLAPIFAAIAIRIRIEDGGPVFFKQIRVGRNGQPFKVWKFRTMVIDAPRLQANLSEQNEGNGALFKMRRDPRITKPGMGLRRYSLDELPQLINVARGEMSIVGPRPALPEETAKYNGTHMTRRIVVKPGITGLWQVSGRSDLSLADSMRLDVHYVENWSLVLDLQILWKTAWAVLGGGGAY
jgi:exopolysaccharide biosynthesis polyprenyl glycosylphosphotransferase